MNGLSSSATDGRYLTSWTGNVYAQGSDFRGIGFALRCVTFIVAHGADKP